MYNEYAVGRIAACPRCGVHIEKDEGSSSVTCLRCNCKFEFKPFRTYREVDDAENETASKVLFETELVIESLQLGFHFFSRFILMVLMLCAVDIARCFAEAHRARGSPATEESPGDYNPEEDLPSRGTL